MKPPNQDPQPDLPPGAIAGPWCVWPNHPHPWGAVDSAGLAIAHSGIAWWPATPEDRGDIYRAAFEEAAERVGLLRKAIAAADDALQRADDADDTDDVLRAISNARAELRQVGDP